jgi:hypothetical protein
VLAGLKKKIKIILLSILGVIIFALLIYVFFDVEGFIFRNQIVAHDFDGANAREIPTIRIDTDRLERMTHGRSIVRPAFVIENDGTLLSWRLNGRLLPRTFNINDISIPPVPPGLSGENRFYNIHGRTITLREGENELLIRARGTTGLITERRISITSDQTTPQELRTVPTFYRASVSYEPENPMIVTVTLEIEEGDFGDVLVFADTSPGIRESLSITTIDERTFEFTTELMFWGQMLELDRYGRNINISAENKWGITRGEVSIISTHDSPLIFNVRQGGSAQELTSGQWATSLPFPPPRER